MKYRFDGGSRWGHTNNTITEELTGTKGLTGRCFCSVVFFGEHRGAVELLLGICRFDYLVRKSFVAKRISISR